MREKIIEYYIDKFNQFTWTERTVGSYQKFVKKLLKDFELSIRKDIKNNINELLN